jgi:phosphoserine phosphatase
MSYDVICFDCDSTLSKIEGIDELAKRAGVGAEMARLTDLAMNGELPLEAVYGKRLDAIRPSLDSINWLAELYIKEIVDGVKTVFTALLAQNRQVHIISGGLRQAIEPLANYLALPLDHVHAVDIFFHADGSYRGFDQNSPLARAGGKAEICRQLMQQSASLVLVGDGKTDLEAKQAGAFVVGFGGVADRPIVRQLADRYVLDPSLLSVLAYL